MKTPEIQRKRLKIAVLITAYNEGRELASLLEKFDSGYDVFLIDDGSRDDTAAIARSYGAKVVSHPVNLGQGMALVTGFRLLAPMGYDMVIEMDGDGQHDPTEIPVLVKKMQESGCDVVAGSRILGENYKGAPLARRIFLSPLTWVINRLTGYSLSDSMCGFRAFKGSALMKVSSILDKMIEPEYIASEMWIKFAKAGLTATDAPIHLAGRKHGFSYKGMLRYGWGVCSTIIRSKLDTLKYQ